MILKSNSVKTVSVTSKSTTISVSNVLFCCLYFSRIIMDASVGSWKYDLGRSPGIKEALAQGGELVNIKRTIL